MLCSASNRMTEDVPQQNAAPQASFDAMTMSKKKRCSSGQTLVSARLLWIGSGLKKCCGVCTTPTSGSSASDSARVRKFGQRHEIGVEDRNEVRFLVEARQASSDAALMLPAFAWALSSRVR